MIDHRKGRRSPTGGQPPGIAVVPGVAGKKRRDGVVLRVKGANTSYLAEPGPTPLQRKTNREKKKKRAFAIKREVLHRRWSKPPSSCTSKKRKKGAGTERRKTMSELGGKLVGGGP